MNKRVGGINMRIEYTHLRPGRTSLRMLRIADAPAAAYFAKNSPKDPAGTPVKLVEICNGRLTFTVIIDRGLEVGDAWFDGRPLGWRSPNPLWHPSGVDLTYPRQLVETRDVIENLGWLRGFYSFDTLIGCCNLGGPGPDPETGEMLTLHGRISYSTADETTVALAVQNNEMVICGSVTEKGPDGNARFRMDTEIRTGFNATSFRRTDTIENVTDNTTSFEFGHHIQIGPPTVRENAIYHAPRSAITPRDTVSETGLAEVDLVPAPQCDYYPEQVFFQTLNPLGTGLSDLNVSFRGDNVTGTMVSDQDGSFGVYELHKTAQFPVTTLWKQFGGWQFDPEGNKPMWYTCCTEPQTTIPAARAEKRAQNSVPHLGPGEKQSFELEIGALASASEVSIFDAAVKDNVTV